MYWHSDKVAHLMSMFLLTSISLFALPSVREYWVFLGAVVAAGAIEFMQIFGPRSADFADFFWSAAGTFVVAMVYYSSLFRSRSSKKYGRDAKHNQ